MVDKIDVTIATKNNEDTIGKCIQCIKKYIPYNRIILIDDSDDSTPEIARALGAEVVHFSARLGPTRIKQAEVSTTEWIASIDSDIFVYPNWWETMSRYIANDVGIVGSFVEGSIKEMLPSYDVFTKWTAAKRFRRTKRTSAMGSNLIRKEILLSCKKKLLNIHAGEDKIIGQHILETGYKCAVNKEINGLHYHRDPIAHSKMACYRSGGSAVINKGKLQGLTLAFCGLPYTAMQWLSYSLDSRSCDYRLLSFLLSLELEAVKGAINEIKSGS